MQSINFFKKKVDNKWTKRILFLIAFVTLFFVYNGDEIFFSRPQSVHIWRQTNGLSITKLYSQQDNSLWQPEMHNLYGNNGSSGKAAGEFPVIYYFVGKLWHIFGSHEWIFRLVQLIIIFSGLFLLFEILQYFFENVIYSFWASLILFTSPMNVFYGLNFLPDLPSLSLVLVAWFFIFKYYCNRKTYFLWISALFFFLGISIKITSALSFIALAGWIFFEWIFLTREKRVFNFKIKHVIPFFIMALAVTTWYLYTDYYNALYKGGYSYHGIFPIWDMSKERILKIFDSLKHLLFREFFWSYLQFISFGLWVFLMINIRKLPLILRYSVIVFPLGFLGYLILWFDVLDVHDYYFITSTIVMVVVWGIFFYWLKGKRYFQHPLIQLVFVGFFVANVIHCQNRINDHYKGWMNDWFKNNLEAVGELEPYLEKIGVQKDDKVISIPDYTMNATLYFMNRKGYTEYASDFSKTEEFYRRIEQGAKFLIVNDSTVLKNESVKPFVGKQIGQYKNVFVYDLQGIKKEE